MEFNDGNQWHYVVNVGEYVGRRDVYEMRTCSADPDDGYRMYVDRRFADQRAKIQPRVRAYLHYQFPYERAGTPERQADFFADALGGRLRSNEMIMLDCEHVSGLRNPADFTRRWCAAIERRLGTLAWVYVPSALADELPRNATGRRLVKAPRYSGGRGIGARPTWPHDVHQYTDRGFFPGCHDGIGDVNVTPLTSRQLLARSTLGDPAKTPPAARPVLDTGDTGEWVRFAQRLLNEAGV